MSSAAPVRYRNRRANVLQLTPRELLVLRLSNEGLSALEIAERLRLAQKTVGRYLMNARDKVRATGCEV